MRRQQPLAAHFAFHSQLWGNPEGHKCIIRRHRRRIKMQMNIDFSRKKPVFKA
jgi:hypothetical protein